MTYFFVCGIMMRCTRFVVMISESALVTIITISSDASKHTDMNLVANCRFCDHWHHWNVWKMTTYWGPIGENQTRTSQLLHPFADDWRSYLRKQPLENAVVRLKKLRWRIVHWSSRPIHCVLSIYLDGKTLKISDRKINSSWTWLKKFKLINLWTSNDNLKHVLANLEDSQHTQTWKLRKTIHWPCLISGRSSLTRDSHARKPIRTILVAERVDASP